MSESQAARETRHWVVRFGGEAVLIVASVFVAILLESMWQDRSEVRDARESLAQVRLSLAEDVQFFDRVEQEQQQAAEKTRRLLEWFEDPEALPNDAVHEVFLDYNMPISIWPRRAAWNTMVNSGQFRLLEAPELVTRIGNYYEHHLRRMEYNGQQYDAAFTVVSRGELTELWDFDARVLLTRDASRLTQFRNRLRRIDDWTTYYLGRVERNRARAESLIEEIDAYLD